ncbi:hypothetical protein SAMN05216317_11819 [Nitrosomonas eutropha]|uniref:Transposase, Mutator family n=1 Tax=Nitrosomonas eutropha TaxID=916 RepID=A0ABX5M7B3_9PROT|nr:MULTISPECIES: hypothetical protein [Nitrosomonas]PXV81611.1 hypothetical protein C8R14_11153 [Nitrosomonas eutropha]SCX22675.1 hypothetical protein SAMN05216379_11920 [Nitrosomonas eutropha]SDW91622.1 hypothetical protein SAMN05216317_11819 [Nitrosomonas eutropha]
MTDDTVLELNDPEQNDSLRVVLREGARKLLAAMIESEVAAFIKQQGGLDLPDTARPNDESPFPPPPSFWRPRSH